MGLKNLLAVYLKREKRVRQSGFSFWVFLSPFGYVLSCYIMNSVELLYSLFCLLINDILFEPSESRCRLHNQTNINLCVVIFS